VPARSGARARVTRFAPLHAHTRDAALVGLAAALLVGTLLGAGGAQLVACALLGTAAGAVLGVLLWIEAAELPEAPIPAPALGVRHEGSRAH
jgi:hypothetical protein